MKKRIVIEVALAVLLVASACAQTPDFLKLIKTGTPQSIQDAIDKGADVNAKDKSDVTPLMLVAKSNPNPDVITTLLKAGADIEARDSPDRQTALIYAAEYNSNPEVITMLLKAGADINVKDWNSYTVLMWAAYKNQSPEVVIALLNAGANAKVKLGDGVTAFDLAQFNEKLKGTDALKQLEEASK